MNHFIETIKNLISRVLGETPSPEQQKEDLVRGLMAALRDTRPDELSCDEVFEVVDQYAEAIVQGKDAQELMPLVHHHINMCGECREELELLLEMMQIQTA